MGSGVPEGAFGRAAGIGILVFLAVQGMLLWQVPGVLEGQLNDQDAYLRLERVFTLIEGGGWFDPVIARTYPPIGETSHWTRPLDLLLMAGALPLSAVLPLKTALVAWGAVLVVLLGAATVAAFVWALEPTTPPAVRLLAGPLAATQMSFACAFLPGRPDHQTLNLLFFVLLLGVVVRRLESPEGPSRRGLGGLIAGLALWVSIEAFIALGAFTAVLAAAWLGGRERMARDLAGLWGSAAAVIALALAVERAPATWLAVEYDRLSIVHLATALAIALAWGALARLEGGSVLSRLAAAALAAGAAILVLSKAFPGWLAGPLADVPGDVLAFLDAAIVENQPLMGRNRQDPGLLTIVGGSSILALAVLTGRLVWLRGHRWRDGVMLFLLAVFFALTLHMMRWGMYAQTLAAAALLVPAGAVLAGIPTGRPSVLRALVGGAMVLLVSFAPGFIIAAATARPEPPRACSANGLVRMLTAPPLDRTQRLLLVDSVGPEVLFRTPHALNTTGLHRGWRGIRENRAILDALDDGEAFERVRERGIEAIAVCPAYHWPGAVPGSLRQRLIADLPPAWLRPVNGEGGPAGFRLFEVVTAGSPPPPASPPPRR